MTKNENQQLCIRLCKGERVYAQVSSKGELSSVAYFSLTAVPYM